MQFIQRLIVAIISILSIMVRQKSAFLSIVFSGIAICKLVAIDFWISISKTTLDSRSLYRNGTSFRSRLSGITSVVLVIYPLPYVVNDFLFIVLTMFSLTGLLTLEFCSFFVCDLEYRSSNATSVLTIQGVGPHLHRRYSSGWLHSRPCWLVL